MKNYEKKVGFGDDDKHIFSRCGGLKIMAETYSVRVYCNQCETHQIVQLAKGHTKDEAEDKKCPNCGLAELELDY